ncbi:MAG: fasciclin domain-containing protein [Sphingomicrobium sp.]
MTNKVLMIGVAAAMLGTAACNSQGGGNAPAEAQSSEAKELAGDKTISAGLAADGKFLAAAKSAGLDQTLAGPGPYTVFVPSDAALANAPGGTFDGKPGNRAQVTGALTNLILPGTVMAEDIGKAIDNAKGKAVLATMGGGTLTATKDGDAIVLTDSAGNKATVTKADERFSNGVVHHIDALLMPNGGTAPAAAGTPTGQ